MVELEVLTEVVVDEVRGLVVGERELVVRETVVVTKVRLDDVVGRVPPPASSIAAFRGAYQQLASLTLPLSLGCTPSPVSVVVS